MEKPIIRVTRDQKVTDPYFDSYVCLDIETTSRPANRIIEVAAVKVIRGRIVKEFRRLVDPGIKIPKDIVKLTGITDSMVKGRRNIWQVLPELKNFIGDEILVGHDIINNDMKNLLTCANNLRMDFNNPVFDTFTFSKTFMDGTCGLSALCETLLVPWEQRHRALSDAKANMEVFEKLKIIYYMLENEGINLTDREMAKIVRNPQFYAGVTEKFTLY